LTIFRSAKFFFRRSSSAVGGYFSRIRLGHFDFNAQFFGSSLHGKANAAAFGIDSGEYVEIAGVVTSCVSVVSYIFAEGAVDRAAASKSEAE